MHIVHEYIHVRVSSRGGARGSFLPPPPRERERERERARHDLLLHVALLEDDWSSPSLTTNLSISFVYIISTVVSVDTVHNFKPAYQVTCSCRQCILAGVHR